MGNRPKTLTITFYTDPKNLRVITLPVWAVQGALGTSLLTVGLGLFIAVGGINQYMASKSKRAEQYDLVQITQDRFIPVPEPRSIQVSAKKFKKTSKTPHAVAAPQQAIAQPVIAKIEEEVKAEIARKKEISRTIEPMAKKVTTKPQVTGKSTYTSNRTPSSWSQTKEVRGTDKNISVAVDERSLQHYSDQVAFEVDILNKTRGRISGSVWAVATFVDRNGNEVVVGSDRRVDTESIASRNNRAYGKSFKASRFSIKKFSFPKPEGGYRLKQMEVIGYNNGDISPFRKVVRY